MQRRNLDVKKISKLFSFHRHLLNKQKYSTKSRPSTSLERQTSAPAALSCSSAYLEDNVLQQTDELEALQSLHSWRLAKASPELIELIFEERFLVAVPCERHQAIPTEITITRIESSGKRREDPFPLLSELSLRQGEAYVRSLKTASIKPVRPS